MDFMKGMQSNTNEIYLINHWLIHFYVMLWIMHLFPFIVCHDCIWRKSFNRHAHIHTQQRRQCETMTKPTSQSATETNIQIQTKMTTTTIKTWWQILYESLLSVGLENYTYIGSSRSSGKQSIEHQIVIRQYNIILTTHTYTNTAVIHIWIVDKIDRPPLSMSLV